MSSPGNPFKGLGEGDEPNPFASLGTTPLDEASLPSASTSSSSSWWDTLWHNTKNIVKGTVAATPEIIQAPFEGLGAANEFMQESVKQVAGVSPREAYAAALAAPGKPVYAGLRALGLDTSVAEALTNEVAKVAGDFGTNPTMLLLPASRRLSGVIAGSSAISSLKEAQEVKRLYDSGDTVGAAKAAVHAVASAAITIAAGTHAARTGRFQAGGPPGPGRPRDYAKQAEEPTGPTEPVQVSPVPPAPFEGLGAEPAAPSSDLGGVPPADVVAAPVAGEGVPVEEPKPTVAAEPTSPPPLAPTPFSQPDNLPPHIAPSIRALPTDQIFDPALRLKAEDAALGLAKLPMAESAKAPLPPELEPHRDAIVELADDINHSEHIASAALRATREEYAHRVRGVPDGIWESPDEVPGHSTILQIKSGKIVGFAEAVNDRLSFIAGGKDTGSPVSIRPLYEYVRAKFEPDTVVTAAGELTRRRKIRSYVEEQKQNGPPEAAAEAGGAQAEPNLPGGEVRPALPQDLLPQSVLPPGGGEAPAAPDVAAAASAAPAGPVAALTSSPAGGAAEEGFRGLAGEQPPTLPAAETVGALALGGGGGGEPPPPTPPSGGPPSFGEPPRPPGFAGRVASIGGRVQRIADTFQALAEKFSIASREAGTIAEEGTIGAQALPKAEREALREKFRAAGQPASELTHTLRTSAADIEQAGAELLATHQELVRIEKEGNATQDPDSVAQVKVARKLFEDAVKRWQVYRSAAGRQLHVFQRPVPLDMIAAARDAAAILGTVQPRQKLPIVTSIIENLKQGVTQADYTRLFKDVVDHFRLNLFSVSSWTLDMVGNAGELIPQAAEAAGRDLVHVAKGNVSFPSLQGIFRAIRYRTDLLPPDVQERLGTNTIGGEIIPGHVYKGPGVFTMREGVGEEGSLTRKVTKAGSTIYDYLVGGPLYAKNVIDTVAKRFSALSVIYRDAITAADKAGATGLERQAFIEDFTRNIPADTKEAAIRQGNKAGFNRELSTIEENIAGSYTARLFVDVFARWPFQFARWGGEMLGYNGDLLDRTLQGKASLEDLGGYLTKTATGLGGLYLLNQVLYNRIDFHSMEYVDEDGNRVRLSNRDPIPTGLFFLALLHRDPDRAAASLQFASLPGAHLIAGQGGIFGSFLQVVRNTAQNPTGDPHQLRRELEDMFNRAIPGQALLGALETVVDPAVREGIGANIPGYSSTLPTAVESTTGEPLSPVQKIRIAIGDKVIETPTFPSISGVPIPGATRELDPVHKLLARYGMLVYRGPRTPVAGIPADQLDPDQRREWLMAFGRYRQAYLLPLTQGETRGELASMGYEAARKVITRLDTVAARAASYEISSRYGGPPKPPRQPSRFELTGPPAYFEENR